MRKTVKNNEQKPYIGLYCTEEFKAAVVKYADDHNMFIKDVVIAAINQYLGLEPEGEN